MSCPFKFHHFTNNRPGKILINPRRDVIKMFTLVGPQQRQKRTSREEPGCKNTGVLGGKCTSEKSPHISPEFHQIAPQVYLQHV
jgi:hypothetical protein